MYRKTISYRYIYIRSRFLSIARQDLTRGYLKMSSPFTLQNDRIGKQAVFDIFSDYLGAETPTTAVQAANAVSKLVPRPADDSKTLEDGFFFAFWKDIFEVAGQIPHDHPAMDKLVKFMRELTLLNDTGLKVWEVSWCSPFFLQDKTRYKRRERGVC